MSCSLHILDRDQRSNRERFEDNLRVTENCSLSEDFGKTSGEKTGQNGKIIGKEVSSTCLKFRSLHYFAS